MDQTEEKHLEDRLRSAIEAYHASALAYAAVKLGLPERMGERRWTAESLAAELGLSPPHLLRFLRGLVTLGICEERPDGSFALTSLGQSLEPGSPSRLAEKVTIVVEQYWRPWADLVSTLQTGAPAFDRMFGMPVSKWRRENEEQGALYSAYLAEENFAQAADVVEAINFAGVKTVAQIAGGYGGLLAAALRTHSGLEGVLFSPPHVVERAAGFLHSHGVAERVKRVGGDVRAEIPVEADLYLLKGALQQWDDANAAAILKACRRAMPPHAKLLIIERPLPESASKDAAEVMLDLHMMVINGGRVRTLQEFEALLAQADLAMSKVHPTQSGLSIIEALPA
jgi:AraC-like DNA-binding protein